MKTSLQQTSAQHAIQRFLLLLVAHPFSFFFLQGVKTFLPFFSENTERLSLTDQNFFFIPSGFLPPPFLSPHPRLQSPLSPGVLSFFAVARDIKCFFWGEIQYGCYVSRVAVALFSNL